MLHRLHLILQQDCHLDAAQTILIGVSGGADSLTLLDALHCLGYPLIVAHFNHRLRPEAGDDARAVGRLAEERGAPFVLGEADVPAFAKANLLSVEEAARTLRYRFLFGQAEQFGAQAVAVAHTADDQIETALMHLLRGAGLAGLKGMPAWALPTAWSERIPLARPLLSFWRAEIDAYCAERGLTPLADQSNQDTAYFRNRLRHELIPYLRSYNPQIKALLWRTTQVLAADQAVLEQVVDAAWEGCDGERGSGWVAWNAAKLQAQPVGVRRRLLRRGLALLRPGLRDIEFETVERALGFLARPPQTGQCDLAAGLRLLWEADRLWLAAWESDLPGSPWPQVTAGPFELDVPGSVSLPGGWLLSAQVVDDVACAYAQAIENADPFRAWIAADKLDQPLVVRSRRPGDRFQPLGMTDHSVKLSDLMINLKLPRRARPAWPLICSGNEIIWAPGCRLGHRHRLTASSQGAIFLALRREGV
jgi:tRNA(Ile)-lysidine synthase